MQYILTGDIAHPGRIDVEADSLDEALEKVAEGQFIIYEEEGKNLTFTWNGEEPDSEEDAT